jgi:hypothetical protein
MLGGTGEKTQENEFGVQEAFKHQLNHSSNDNSQVGKGGSAPASSRATDIIGIEQTVSFDLMLKPQNADASQNPAGTINGPMPIRVHQTNQHFAIRTFCNSR